MSARRPGDGPREGGTPPADLRATELEVGGERLVVLSYSIDAPDLRTLLGLTAAEAEVAELAISGLSNAEIARMRRASVRTVANQIAAVLRKAGVGSRSALAAFHARGAFAPRDDGTEGSEG